MSYEDFDHLAGGLSSLATMLALGIGGLWAYQRFVRTREAHPRIEFTVDVSFVIRQDGFWVAEALAMLENKGLVRHDITTFTFDVRYLLPADRIEERDGFAVYLPHRAVEGSWLPPDWGNTFIEPGLRTRYSTLVRVPVDATGVLIHGKFLYANRDWHTADRFVPVPTSAGRGAEAAA